MTKQFIVMIVLNTQGCNQEVEYSHSYCKIIYQLNQRMGTAK
jgi:hypothetical protein